MVNKTEQQKKQKNDKIYSSTFCAPPYTSSLVYYLTLVRTNLPCLGGKKLASVGTPSSQLCPPLPVMPMQPLSLPPRLTLSRPSPPRTTTTGTVPRPQPTSIARNFTPRISDDAFFLPAMAASSSSSSSFAQVPVNTLMDHHDGPLQQQHDWLAALFKVLASEEDRSRALFGKALRAHAPSPQTPPDPLLESFHALLHTRTQAHTSYLQALQDNVRRPWQGLCQHEHPREHMKLKKEWNQIVTGYHQRRQQLDIAKRMLSHAVQEEAAALARALSTNSTNGDEACERGMSSFGSHAGDIGKEEAKQRARFQQLAATREEAERRTSLAKQDLLKAIVSRDNFVARAGTEYMDLAKRERRATAAALLTMAAAEKAHCQARVRAAEALEKAARMAGQEEVVDEEVGVWAARHKQPELTHRYYTALTVLDREWERQQHDEDEGEGAWEGKVAEEETKEMRELDAFLAGLLGPAATCDDDEEEERANALRGRRSGGTAASSSSLPPPFLSSSFTTLIDTPSGRAYFLRQLNARRGGGTCLKPEMYDKLGACLTLLLDKCQTQNDVRAAQQALLMANTFFRLSSSAESESEVRSTTSITTANSSTTPRSVYGLCNPSSSTRQSDTQPAQHQSQDEQPKREYLLACVHGHAWWQSRQVWKEALTLNVEHELSQCPQQRPWESLPSDALRGQVLRVHNLIFGQLGSLALHMLECGVVREEMRAFVREMCEQTQMGAEQVQAMMEAAIIMVGGRVEEENELS